MTYDELLEAFRADGWTVRKAYSSDNYDELAFKRLPTRFCCFHNDEKKDTQLVAQIYDRRIYCDDLSEWGVELVLYGSTADNENFRLMMHGFDAFAEIQTGCGKLIKAWEALNETAL